MAGTTTVELATVQKWIETLCFALGPAVLAYYLFSFTVDQHGYYYRDTELGIAGGVFLVSLGYVVRRLRAAG